MFQCLANLNNFIYENLFCGKKRKRVPSSIENQLRLYSKGNFRNYFQVIDIANKDEIEIESCKLIIKKNLHLLSKNEIDENLNDDSISKMYLKFNIFCKFKNDFLNFPFLKYDSLQKVIM
jgi:hypothetical protein